MTTKNILTGLLIIAVFAVGFLFGAIESPYRPLVENKQTPMHTQNTPASTTSNASSPENATSSIVSKMTDDQKKMLSALGIDMSKITSGMVACAETSLGTERVDEIMSGSPVSFIEKGKLIACYNK